MIYVSDQSSLSFHHSYLHFSPHTPLNRPPLNLEFNHQHVDKSRRRYEQNYVQLFKFQGAARLPVHREPAPLRIRRCVSFKPFCSRTAVVMSPSPTPMHPQRQRYEQDRCTFRCMALSLWLMHFQMNAPRISLVLLTNVYRLRLRRRVSQEAQTAAIVSNYAIVLHRRILHRRKAHHLASSLPQSSPFAGAALDRTCVQRNFLGISFGPRLDPLSSFV